MNNNQLREKMKRFDVKQWEIAEFLGIPEASFSRKMRHELNADLRSSALNAVETIAERKKQNVNNEYGGKNVQNTIY